MATAHKGFECDQTYLQSGDKHLQQVFEVNATKLKAEENIGPGESGGAETSCTRRQPGPGRASHDGRVDHPVSQEYLEVLD